MINHHLFKGYPFTDCRLSPGVDVIINNRVDIMIRTTNGVLNWTNTYYVLRG